uniref:Uncharacterized protein n=1 Tax=Rhizophora mucronata TaxID=61149 RepID=A0A2P2NL65_RHIMU
MLLSSSFSVSLLKITTVQKTPVDRSGFSSPHDGGVMCALALESTEYLVLTCWTS